MDSKKLSNSTIENDPFSKGFYFFLTLVLRNKPKKKSFWPIGGNIGIVQVKRKKMGWIREHNLMAQQRWLSLKSIFHEHKITWKKK